jgi:hypothetical protein
MLPMCAEMGVGCIPYSPQGRGRRTRRGGADPAFCQGCGCEDLRLDVTLTGAEIRMLGEPFTPQARPTGSRKHRQRRKVRANCSLSLGDPGVMPTARPVASTRRERRRAGRWGIAATRARRPPRGHDSHL